MAALAAAAREQAARPLRAAYVAALEALAGDREVFFGAVSEFVLACAVDVSGAGTGALPATGS